MWAASCLASCCATCACQACTGIIGSISRRSARIAYCGLFALSLVVAWLLRDCAWPVLEKIPWINHFSYTPSKEWFATQAVLRVSLGNFSFFSALALLMVGVKYQDDQRDSWHHGAWMVKFVCWLALIVLAFVLPNPVVNAYGTLSKFGSGVFLLVQVIILLDFTHHWNAAWVEKDEQFWYIALLVVSLVSYISSFVFSGLLFHFFNPKGLDCQLNIFFITTSLIFGVAFAVIALHPQVNGSLLPASIIAVYSTYLCYSALSSEPRGYECNGLHKHAEVVSTSTLLMGITTTLLSVVYSAVRAGSSTALLSPPDSPRQGSARPLLSTNSSNSSEEAEMEEGKRKKSAERRPVTYVYSFFYLIFALASMYSAMLLTGWGSSGEQGSIGIGWTSVWVRVCTMWFTAGLYIWSLVAPLVFPDREFN